MQLGDIVKVFSSISDYDGQTGRIILIASDPGAPAPYVVQFGDALTETFSERELVPMSPISSLWLSASIETLHAPHGATGRAQIYVGRAIADRFMAGERRRVYRHAEGIQNAWDKKVRDLTQSITAEGRKQLTSLAAEGYGTCLQCGALFCEHKFKP